MLKLRKKQVKSREISLQAIYQFDMSSRSESPIKDSSELESFIAAQTQDPETREFARNLIDGVLSMVEILDQHIAAAASSWKIDRIASIDRSILRIALYEMMEIEDVPPKVSINEAIELAKKFSTAQSGSFVNGILDRLYQDLDRTED